MVDLSNICQIIQDSGAEIRSQDDLLRSSSNKLNIKLKQLMQQRKLVEKIDSRDMIWLWRKNRLQTKYIKKTKLTKLLIYLTGTEEQKQKVIQDLKIPIVNNLAACMFQKEKYDTAITLCTTVLQMDPTNKRAFMRRANAYFKNGEYSSAKNQFKVILNKYCENENEKKEAQDKIAKCDLKLGKEKNVYNKMFKSEIYVDKKAPPSSQWFFQNWFRGLKNCCCKKKSKTK